MFAAEFNGAEGLYLHCAVQEATYSRRIGLVRGAVRFNQMVAVVVIVMHRGR
jgi:hypothetical protein